MRNDLMQIKVSSKWKQALRRYAEAKHTTMSQVMIDATNAVMVKEKDPIIKQMLKELNGARH